MKICNYPTFLNVFILVTISTNNEIVFLISLILQIELGLCKYLTGTDRTVAFEPFPVT